MTYDQKGNRCVCIGRWSSCAAVVVCLLLQAVSVANAQQAPPKKWKLSKIEAPNLHRFTPDQILTMSGLQIGQTVDLDVVDAALGRLNQTGFFARATYRYHYVNDQLTVTFNLEEGKSNAPIIFDNFVWFSDEELTRAVAEVIPNYDGTAPNAGGDVIAKITAALEKLLRTKNVAGRVEYNPSYEVSGKELGHVFAVRDVTIPVCSIKFTGTSAVSENDLIKNSKPLIKADYSRSFVADFVRDNLVPIYREHGHLRVQFSDPQAKPDDGTCKNGVQVTLSVNEGAAYSLDKTEWNGNSVLTTMQLDALMEVSAGDLANGLKIDKSFKSIQAAYGKKGYIKVKLSTMPNFDDAKKLVAYRVAFTEGGQYHMGNVSFTGLSDGDATRLRNAWKLREGDVFNLSYFDDYMRVWLPSEEPLRAKLQNLSIKPDTEHLTVDVAFKFK